MSKKPLKKIIFKKFKIIKNISNGSYGDVHLGQYITTKEQVAIKIEDKKTKKQKTLEKEAYYLYILKGLGIPRVISYGYSGNYNILVETLLGKSLHVLNTINKFTLKDICMIGIQVLSRLKYIHSKYIIHCDIKPENLLVGKKDPSVIYLCDFGISQKYRSSITGKHIKMKKYPRIYVSPIFCSINSILGYQQSRRDDLESLGYMLIHFIKGLPWDIRNCNNNNDLNESLKKLLNIKRNISMENLCKDLPIEIYEYMRHVKNLKFEEKPNYTYLNNLFYSILFKMNEICDNNFSWNQNNNKKRLIFRNISFISKNRVETTNKNIQFQEINNFIQRRNNSESKINAIFINNLKNKNKNDKNLNNTSSKNNSQYVIDFWTKLAEKKQFNLTENDNDLEVENNLFINYNKLSF